ncbi:family 43 glycosylhydrolase [Arachidicoccus ginsenosidivorans]|jgi:beta-fructofuranosidase
MMVIKTFRDFIIWMGLFFALTFCGACNKSSSGFVTADLTNPVSIFPAPPTKWLAFEGTNYYSSGYVGDVMPYFDNDSFHIFYLHDGDANGGYHPIHEFTTTDIVHFDYQGKMIAYGADNDQDRALGTGSVIKVGDTYYFYYTGHNDLHWQTGEPVEGVMYATSKDLKNWTKHSSYTLYPSVKDGYGANDFRDPFLFYNENTQQYEMLVSCIRNNRPVIALYTSSDPASDSWALQDPFYTSDNAGYGVMECSDLFKIGNYWYLIFSENGINHTTHYRMATSPNGPWSTPAIDVLDGAYFYAGKTAGNGQKRYLFGWTYRKSGQTDYGDKIWAGNLVTHQLSQNADGTLAVSNPEVISNLFTKSIQLQQDSILNTSVTGNNYQLLANGFSGFDILKGQRKINCVIKGLKQEGEAGFAFGYGRTESGDFYKLRFKNGEAYLLKVQGEDEYIDCQVPFNFASGSDIAISIIIDNSVISVTINNSTTLTGRLYWLPSAKWGIYSLQSGVNFKDLSLWSNE